MFFRKGPKDVGYTTGSTEFTIDVLAVLLHTPGRQVAVVQYHCGGVFQTLLFEHPASILKRGWLMEDSPWWPGVLCFALF